MSHNDMNRKLIEAFRANGGKVGGYFEGMNLLILTTKGAKTGLPREHLLAYSKDGDRYVVVASKGGAPTNPQWYHNLKANPEVKVEVDSKSFQARAIVAEGEECQRLFDQHAALMPGFAEYQRNTTQVLPVIALKRVE